MISFTVYRLQESTWNKLCWSLFVFFFGGSRILVFQRPWSRDFRGAQLLRRSEDISAQKGTREEGKKEHTGCKKQFEGFRHLLKSLFGPYLRQTCRVNFGASSSFPIPPPPSPDPAIKLTSAANLLSPKKNSYIPLNNFQ